MQLQSMSGLCQILFVTDCRMHFTETGQRQPRSQHKKFACGENNNLSDAEIRSRLKIDGYSKSRVSKLLKENPAESLYNVRGQQNDVIASRNRRSGEHLTLSSCAASSGSFVSCSSAPTRSTITFESAMHRGRLWFQAWHPTTVCNRTIENIVRLATNSNMQVEDFVLPAPPDSNC